MVDCSPPEVTLTLVGAPSGSGSSYHLEFPERATTGPLSDGQCVYTPMVWIKVDATDDVGIKRVERSFGGYDTRWVSTNGAPPFWRVYPPPASGPARSGFQPWPDVLDDRTIAAGARTVDVRVNVEVEDWAGRVARRSIGVRRAGFVPFHEVSVGVASPVHAAAATPIRISGTASSLNCAFPLGGVDVFLKQTMVPGGLRPEISIGTGRTSFRLENPRVLNTPVWHRLGSAPVSGGRWEFSVPPGSLPPGMAAGAGMKAGVYEGAVRPFYEGAVPVAGIGMGFSVLVQPAIRTPLSGPAPAPLPSAPGLKAIEPVKPVKPGLPPQGAKP
jgi:hypothetical protein